MYATFSKKVRSQQKKVNEEEEAMATPVDRTKAAQLLTAIRNHLNEEANERTRCIERRQTAACVRAKEAGERAVAAYSELVQLYGGKKLSPGEKCASGQTLEVGRNVGFCFSLSEDNPRSVQRRLLDAIIDNLRAIDLLYFHAPTSLKR